MWANVAELSPRHWFTRAMAVFGRFELLWALLSGVLVYFVLAVYQPFGTREVAINFKLARLAGYGLLATILVYGALRRCRLGRMRPGWRRSDEIRVWGVWFLAAACLSYLYYCWAFVARPSLYGFWSFLQFFASVAVLPLFLVWLAGTRAISATAVETIVETGPLSDLPASDNPQTTQPSREALVPAELILFGENKDERLAVDLDTLLWVRGADNYVELISVENASVKVRLLRSSLASVQQQFAGTRVVRAHRSHLVNLARVSHSRGNSQGLKLYLRDLDEPVAVSRAYVEPIRSALGLELESELDSRP